MPGEMFRRVVGLRGRTAGATRTVAGELASLPFAPWLVAGALLCVLAGGEVAGWYGRVLLDA